VPAPWNLVSKNHTGRKMAWWTEAWALCVLGKLFNLSDFQLCQVRMYLLHRVAVRLTGGDACEVLVFHLTECWSICVGGN
jgi:hypothetical protein